MKNNMMKGELPLVKPLKLVSLEDAIEGEEQKVGEQDGGGIGRQHHSRQAPESTSSLQAKSPTVRCSGPNLTRCRIYQWRPISSIKKTRSSALPASHLVRNSRQPRVETASTPDLADNGGGSQQRQQRIYEEKLQIEHEQRIRMNRDAICFDNVRWICIFLNCVLLVVSLLYFGSAVAFTITKDMLLIIMKENLYLTIIVFFYLISCFFWMLAISGFYVLWNMSRKIKIHTALTFFFGILTALVIVFQNSAQNNIETNVESQLISSITFDAENNIKDSWDYFQDTFKCCGVTGFLDWCHTQDLYSKFNKTKTINYLGNYVCSIPDSCCTDYENRSMDVYENMTCVELLESSRMRNVGCVNFLKKEIHHLGKMYKIITGGAVISLILQALTTTILYMYFAR